VFTRKTSIAISVTVRMVRRDGVFTGANGPVGHSGASNKRTYTCENCGASFRRRSGLMNWYFLKDLRTDERVSDVKKKHLQRCARGLHTRRKTRPEATTPDDQSQPQSAGQEHDTAPQVAPCTGDLDDLSQVPFSSGLGDDITIEAVNASLTLHSLPQNDFVDANAADSHLATDHTRQGSPPSIALTFRNMPPRMVSSHVTSYFLHFHAFLPLLHRPTFKLASCPDQLASMVVALGSKYAPSAVVPEGQIEVDTGDELWQNGVESLQILVGLMVSLYFRPCKADTESLLARYATSPV
jgi:hypothetical protein